MIYPGTLSSTTLNCHSTSSATASATIPARRRSVATFVSSLPILPSKLMSIDPTFDPEQRPEPSGQLAELRRRHHGRRPGSRQAAPHNFPKAAWTRRQNHDPVREEDGLRNRMRNEQHGLSHVAPDALDLQVHQLSRHGVERTERLVH